MVRNAAIRAANVLETWDRQANADSRGAVLFANWVQQIDFDKAFSKPWSEKSPRTTADGLANPQNAVALLETAATNVEKAYSKLDVAWGFTKNRHYAGQARSGRSTGPNDYFLMNAQRVLREPLKPVRHSVQI
jgi:acyl-homoserine lactone acylase PvdQ